MSNTHPVQKKNPTQGKTFKSALVAFRGREECNPNIPTGFSVRAADNPTQHQKLMAALIGALELCLESKGLTWEAEQEADIVCARARQVMS